MKNNAFTLWAGPVTGSAVELFPDGYSYSLPPEVELTDNQELTGALLCRSHFFWNWHTIPVYDDSWGPLFIHRNSMGIDGIVRAQTWEDAYGICEDEFFPEADETGEQLAKAYGPGGEDGEDGVEWTENALFQDSYGFRPNGPNDRDTVKHGIYSRDLNGDHLDRLTVELRASLEIALTVCNCYGGYDPFPRWSDTLKGPYVIS